MAIPIIDLIVEGKRAFADKDFDYAVECLESVLKRGQHYADILNILGVIYHHQGRFNEAIASFKEALALNDEYLEPRLNLAILYNDLGNYPPARKLYGKLAPKSRGISIDPILNGQLANQHAAMGDTYRRVGRFAEAADEYRKALSLGPSYADIRTRLGLALREKGDIKGALRELRRACQEKPEFQEARIQLGVTLYASGRKVAALKEWETVLKADRGNLKARMYLRMDGTAPRPTRSKKSSPRKTRASKRQAKP